MLNPIDAAATVTTIAMWIVSICTFFGVLAAILIN